MPLDPRDEMAAALADQAAAERRLHRAVHRARQSGWSWADVAEALGVSRQAAHRRFHAAPAVEPAPGDVAELARPEWKGTARPEGRPAVWQETARDVAERAARAWFAGDLPAMHALMTSTARAALPQAALRRVLFEVEDLAGRCSAPAVTGLHELDGDPLPSEPHDAGRRRAVVVRCVATGEHAEPVVHVLVGPGGRVSGLSVRLSDALEEWPL